MENEQMTLHGGTDKRAGDGSLDSYSPKEQELIRQLVQERLGKKNEIEYESLDDYVVPPKMFFSMIKKPAVSIRPNRMEFSMSSIRLFEGVQHINRSITCPEFVDGIYKMMNWRRECRYKVYGRLANSERGLVLVFDLASAVMFDPLPEEYFDKRTGKMKKRTNKYYPDEIRMRLGRSYSDYMATQERSSFESLSGYMDSQGDNVESTVSDEAAASISIQEQEKKRTSLFGSIISRGGDDNGRNTGG